MQSSVAVPRSRGKRLKLYPLGQERGRPRVNGNRTVWLQAPVHLIHDKLGG